MKHHEETVMQPHDDVGKLRGWPVVFALAHIWLLLVNIAGVGEAASQRLGAPSPLYDFSESRIKTLQLIGTYNILGRLSLLAVGIYLLELLLRQDKRWPTYYVRYGIVFLVFEATLHLQYFLWNAPVVDATFISFWSRPAAYAALMVGWLVYLSRSRRVRAAFVREGSVRSTASWLLYGLGAVMVAWPLVTTLFVDTDEVMAGVLSPRAVTEGYGAAFWVQALSACTGLLVLMKLVFRMKNIWIVVLFPISATVLYFAHLFSGFLHLSG